MADGLINSKPRPRVLILGLQKQVELVRWIAEFAPTVKIIESISSVRQDEWDALITDRQFFYVAAHIHVLSFYETGIADNILERLPGRQDGHLRVSGLHIASEFRRPTLLPDSIRHLVRTTLEPVVRNRDRDLHPAIEIATGGGASSPASLPRLGYSSQPMSLPALEPFLLAGDDQVLAGRYRRSEAAECWMLPQDVDDWTAWIKLAFSHWHESAPERFYGVPVWSRSSRWRTNAETILTHEVEQVEQDKANAVDRFDARLSRLSARLQAAEEAADSYERRLLTGVDDELKNSVMQALIQLGFIVSDSDATNPSDKHREDLQVSDPSVPDWTVLVEVKGSGKGAQTGALTQLSSHRAHFVHTHGRWPAGLWYIVNHFRGQDPDSRQPVLNGRDDDVDAFAEADGLIINTVDLFRLLTLPNPDLASIRARLRTATGRFVADEALD